MLVQVASHCQRPGLFATHPCLTPFCLQAAAEPSGEASNEITFAANSLGITTLLGQSADGTFYSLYHDTCQRLGDTSLACGLFTNNSFEGNILLMTSPCCSRNKTFQFAAGQSVTHSPSKSAISPMHIPGAEEALSPQHMESQLLLQQKVRLHCHIVKSKNRL